MPQGLSMAIKSGFRFVALTGVFIALAVVAAAVIAAVDRSAIWKIVHDRCVPHFQSTGDPAPCASVNLANGVEGGAAVLKDLVGNTQYLLIPTRRVSGIDSRDLDGPGAEDWFAEAWATRRFIFDRLQKKLGPDEIGLAINASAIVSQDQLHIHVDCISAAARDALAKYNSQSEGQGLTQVAINGATYTAAYIASENLANVDVFDLAAKIDVSQTPSARTIIVVGTSSRDRFLLLVGAGHGENLLDHSCAIAR
jgi:CDP-diacylglycerol pyrophosphatase